MTFTFFWTSCIFREKNIGWILPLNTVLPKMMRKVFIFYALFAFLLLFCRECHVLEVEKKTQYKMTYSNVTKTTKWFKFLYCSYFLFPTYTCYFKQFIIVNQRCWCKMFLVWLNCLCFYWVNMQRLLTHPVVYFCVSGFFFLPQIISDKKYKNFH